jgi:hypothetical protein
MRFVTKYKCYKYFNAVTVFSKYYHKLGDRVCSCTYPVEGKLLCVTRVTVSKITRENSEDL